MNLCIFKPHLWAAAALALLSASTFAAVEYTGTPDEQVPVLKTYGVDVPTRVGLKSVLPQGWTLLIHRTATLPESMSWKPGDRWTQALEELAQQQQLALNLDWNKKTVTVLGPQGEKAPVAKAPSSPVVAATDHRAMPPTSAPETVNPPAPASARAQDGAVMASSLTRQAAPVPVTPAPTTLSAVRPLPVPAVAIAPAVAYREPVFPTAASQAQVGGSAKAVVTQLAKRFGYELSWEAPDTNIPGAMTLLGVDLAEDIKLLQNAIGQAQSPLAIEVYRPSSVIHVVPRTQASQAVAILDEPFNGPLANRTLASARANSAKGALEAHSRSGDTTAFRGEQAANDTPVKAATTDGPVTLVVQKGDSLASVLKTFFRAQGWDMQWHASADLQAGYPVTLKAANPKQAMTKLLPKLGLVADFYNPSKLVVIRTADATAH